jgi:hypothetical protein
MGGNSFVPSGACRYSFYNMTAAALQRTERVNVVSNQHFFQFMVSVCCADVHFRSNASDVKARRARHSGAEGRVGEALE